MKHLKLTRFCDAPDDMGTFGFLVIEGVNKRWWTVERPWIENAKDISCIPLGMYKLQHGTYTRNGTIAPYHDLEVLDVPGRKNIEIHGANRADELLGCIAPGKVLALQDWSVYRSRAALSEILAEIGDDNEIEITIARR